MSRAFNFSAGPATLPESVLRQARDELLEWRDAGASLVELSHRGPEFMQVAAEAEADLRALLAVPDDYAVLFTAGGATTLAPIGPEDVASAWRAEAADLTDRISRGVVVVHVAAFAVRNFHGVNDLGVAQWRQRNDVHRLGNTAGKDA